MAFAEFHYFSDALQKQTAVNFVIPDVEGPWEVMFLLHGLSDDHTIWNRRTRLEEYVSGLPLLVVMPDGGRGFYCDAEEGFAYNRAIGSELIGLVRRWFNTKDSWSISGLSMGGYGAIRLALDYPETFRSACALSAALEFGHSPFNRGDDWDREFTRIIGKSPKGGPNDLFHLVETLDRAKMPALRIDCGTEDFLIESNRAFRAHLAALQIPHEYEEHPGAHTWTYWDEHIQPAIAFHRQNLSF